jgi:hypothetical protein
VKGILVFADSYPSPPPASGAPLTAERTSHLQSAELYDGLMFHGPCFQGVLRVERSGQNGCVAQLIALPTAELFRSIPKVLDAAGQLVGFWTAEYLQHGFVVFPYHLEELLIFGPNCSEGERLTCRVELQLRGSAGIRSDIEVGRAGGAVWMQLKGWADRRFDPPPRFHRAWVSPQTAIMSEPWDLPIAGLQGTGDLECYRLEMPERSRGLERRRTDLSTKARGVASASG